mgnify:CR=1 FL=1
MPIEIRELHIRVKVNERENRPRKPGDKTGRKKEKEASEEALVAECVAQTLRVLHNKKER